MPKNITLRDIATETGVSIATVSRALRDDPRTAPLTKKKIKDAAKKMGYRPDPTMRVFIERRWRGRRSDDGMNIAFLYHKPDTISHTFAGEMRRLIETAYNLGYILIPEDLSVHSNAQRLIRKLESKGVSGVVFSFISDPPFPIESITDHFASVCINIESWKPHCPIVMHDEFFGTGRAWKRIRQLGYTRIGALLQYTAGSYSTDLRFGATYCRQNEVEDSENTIPSLLLKNKRPWDQAQIREWIDHHQPEVVLGDDHEQYSILISMGYQVPKDFAFASIHMWNRSLIGEVAGFYRNNVILLERALRLIHMMVHSDTTGPSQADLIEMVKGEWNGGTSLPDLTKPIQL